MLHPQLQQHLRGFSDETANASQQEDEDCWDAQTLAPRNSPQSSTPLPIDSCQALEEVPSHAAGSPKRSHAAGGKAELLLVQAAILWIPLVLQYFDVAFSRSRLGWWMILSLVLAVLMTPLFARCAAVVDTKPRSVLQPHAAADALSPSVANVAETSAEERKIALMEDLQTKVAARLVWMAAPPLCWAQKEHGPVTASTTMSTGTTASLEDNETHDMRTMSTLLVAWMDAHVRWMETVDEVLATLATATSLHLGRTHDTGDATVRRLERATLGRRRVRHLEGTERLPPPLRQWPWLRYRRQLYTVLQAQLDIMEELLHVVMSCGSHDEIGTRNESKDDVVTLSRLRNARFLLADRLSEVVGHLMDSPMLFRDCSPSRPSRLTQWLQQDVARVAHVTVYYASFEHWKEQQKKLAMTGVHGVDPAWTSDVSSLLECAETFKTALQTMEEESHPSESESGWQACRLAYDHLTVRLEAVQTVYFGPHDVVTDREGADQSSDESRRDNERPQGLVERDEYTTLALSADTEKILPPEESLPTTSTLVFAGQGTRARPSTKSKARKSRRTTTPLPPVRSEQSLLAELRRHLATLPSPPEVVRAAQMGTAGGGDEGTDTGGEQGPTDDGLLLTGEADNETAAVVPASIDGGWVLSELAAAVKNHYCLERDETILE